MRVSVILCTYSMERYDEFCAAADSVLAQTHGDVELVVIVDGTTDVYEHVVKDYADHPDTVTHCNDRNRGLSYSRNRGVELASGDVVGFIDDDAILAEDWAEELVGTYERHDAVAVGGKMIPEWEAGEPTFLPPEFYFLIGVTHRGFREDEGPVRNTFSSNLSFCRELFEDLSGFKTDMGKRGENNLQGGETELCARLHRKTCERVIYNPDMIAAHRVYDYRTGRVWLLKRSFWQGYSKRRMEQMVSGSTDAERAFVSDLLTKFIPERLGSLLRDPSAVDADQFAMLLLLTGMAGIGYVWALASDLLD